MQDGTGLGYPVIDIGAFEYTPMGGGSTQVAPTTIVVTPSAYLGTTSTDFTLTATLAAGAQTPTGSVTFYIDGQPLPGSVLISSGIASVTNFIFVPGVHTVYAVYAAQNGFAPAVSLPVIINIPLITTTLLFESESIPPPEPSQSQSSFVGQPVLFTVTVSAADGTTPSPVTITDLTANTLITTLSGSAFNAAGTASYTYSSGFSTIGRHQLVASYAGTKVYAPTSDPLTQIVTGYPTTVTLNCPTATIPFGGTATILVTVSSSDGTPTGPIYLSDAGVAIDVPPANLTNGSASIVYTATASGPRTILASYLASGAFAASSTTCNVDVAPQNTLGLTSSSPLVNGVPTSPAYSPITFTAALTTTTGLTGTYSIAIQGTGGTITAAMTPDAAGTTATYTITSLAPGQYNVSAIFNAASNPVSITATLYPYQLVTIPIGDFTLTGPSTLTATTEKSASATLSLTSIDSFQGTVTLTCNLPLPTSYSCTIAPASVPLMAGGTGSATVTLSPSLNRAASDTASRIVLASLFPLTLISLAGFSRRRKLSALLPLAVLAILAASTTACGKDISYPATQPGSYPFTIKATGTTKGGVAPVTHTLNITLNLTP